MCHNVIQANGGWGDKEGGQIIVPMENRTFPSGLLEREGVTFRNLALVVHTIHVDGADSTVRREDMA